MFADGIVSSSVVGYSGQDVKAGQFYMVAVQFADVGASADVANFNNFFSTTCAPGEYGDGMDATNANAPQINVLDASGLGYTKYYYISDAYDADNNPIEGNCWADALGFIVSTDDVMALSKGFWFKAMENGSITASGQVSAKSTLENSPTAKQFNIVANPYPVALSLNEVKTTDFLPGEYGDGMDTTNANAPQINVLDASGLGYTKYYYISDAYDAEGNPVEGNRWADALGYEATGTQVPVGQSFWVKSESAGTFTFSL